MNRTLLTALFAASTSTLAACGSRHLEAAPLPQEPAVVFDGNYEVTLSSTDPNCVVDDANWTVASTGTQNTYMVDVDTDVSYVQSTRALQAGPSLSWTDRRSYSFQGCDSAVVTKYEVSLDADSNLSGTATQQTQGAEDCGVGSYVCTYAINSIRRQ